MEEQKASMLSSSFSSSFAFMNPFNILGGKRQ
jgi:hypothetical protein